MSTEEIRALPSTAAERAELSRLAVPLMRSLLGTRDTHRGPRRAVALGCHRYFLPRSRKLYIPAPPGSSPARGHVLRSAGRAATVVGEQCRSAARSQRRFPGESQVGLSRSETSQSSSRTLGLAFLEGPLSPLRDVVAGFRREFQRLRQDQMKFSGSGLSSCSFHQVSISARVCRSSRQSSMPSSHPQLKASMARLRSIHIRRFDSGKRMRALRSQSEAARFRWKSR